MTPERSNVHSSCDHSQIATEFAGDSRDLADFKEISTMAFTRYNDYLLSLRSTIMQQRADPQAEATLQIAICRNGYGYKQTEVMGHAPSVQSWRGPLTADRWEQDENGLTQLEIERFFSLPEILGYSDAALKRPCNPVLTIHWDATVALIEISFREDQSVRQQRMMFAGFADPIHAEFSIAMDRDILVRDHETGIQFFEWRTIPNSISAPPRHTKASAATGGSVMVRSLS
jgi:hypothetical protein